MSASRLTTHSDRLSEHVCPGQVMTYKTDPGRIGNHEPSLDSLHLQTTARPFLDDVAPTRPNNRRLSSIIGSTARRCRLVEQDPHQPRVASAIPAHLSKAVVSQYAPAPSMSWSLHSHPILLCDNDSTFHLPLASIPFPDYSQHYHTINTPQVLLHHTLHIPSIFQFALSTG